MFNPLGPLSDPLDRWLRGRRGVAGKALAGAAVVPFLSGLFLARMNPPPPAAVWPRALLVLSAVGCVLGAGLGVKDLVAGRLAAGEPVAWPLRTLFGRGWASLLGVWVPAVFALTLAVTLLTL